MNALVFISALAAQATAPTSSAPAPSSAPPAATTGTEGPTRGQTTYVDLEAGAGYSTNPVLSFDDNPGSAFGRLSIHGVHSRYSERTNTVLSAFAQNVFYTNHYGSEQAVDLNARHDTRVSEKLRLFGDLDLAYDRGGQLDTRIIGVPGVPLVPGTVVPPNLLSPGDFLTVAGKSFRASGHVGGQLALSARDYLTVTSGIEHVVSKFSGLDTHYTTVPASIGYERQISTRTTIGGRLTAQYTDYDGPTDFRTITPQLTIQTALSERMTFSGALGVSFAAVDNGVDTRHTTGLAANANLCSQGERDQFCAHASINEETATSAGPSRSYVAGVDYSRRLGEDETVQLSVSAERYSNPVFFVVGPTFSHATYLRAAADYSRRIHNRLFAGASVSGRKLAQDGPDPNADVTGSVFIRYRLGDAR